jgi:hypothetical protein
MTLAEIYKLLRDARRPDRSLELEAGMFPELASALKAFGLTRVEVREARVEEPGAVTVDGDATMLGKKAGSLHLEVSELPETSALTAKLSFTPPSGWGFADGFPGLPASYGQAKKEFKLVSLGDSVLYGLPLDSAKLTARSGKADLEFDGVLRDASRFTFLVEPLKIPAKPPLAGTIRVRDGAPAEPDLVVAAGRSTLPIGTYLALDAVAIRTHTVARDPSTDGPMTRMDLDATLEVGSTDPVPIGLAAAFYGHDDMLSLSADFGRSGLSIERGAKAFAELLGLPPADFALPKPLDILPKFALQTMTCVVTLDPAAVQRFAITVGPGKSWPIVDGIEVRDLTIGWATAYPFDSKARWMSASIGGTLSLGTVEPRLEFDVYAATDNDFAISGELSHPITLAQIATTINGSPVPGLPGLEVIEAGVSADATGNFGVAVSLGNWHIGDIGDTAIVLYEVTASLERQSGTLKGQFLTVFGVGKARLYVAAKMELGSVDADANSSWVFEGGTQPKTELDIGDLLNELAHTFGIKEVPAPIRSLKLTELKLTYKTAKGEFSFVARAEFKVDSRSVGVMIGIDLGRTEDAAAQPADPRAATVTGSKGYTAKFSGQVTFAKLQFDLVFDTENRKTDVLVADYVKSGPPTALRDFVDPISPSLARSIPEGIKLGLDEVKFVFLKQTDTRWAFGVRLSAGLDLSKLPIVGSKLPAGQTLAVDGLQILYASGDFLAEQTKIVNRVLPKGVTKLPETVGEGISFDADVKLGTTTKHLHAGVTPPAPPPQLPPGEPAAPGTELVPAAAATPASSTDPVKWLDVNKQFGVFSFERVGVGYQDNVLEFALDASVALGPLALSMQGLSVGSPLTRFDPQFNLNGLALTFSRPPVTLGGAFLKVKEKAGGKDVTSYYGQVIVQLTRFGLRALGGWSPDADPAAFFIYVSVKVPIGGPPELYVTGLSGGFGINSALVLPTIDEVGTYPLLPSQAPPEQGNAAETIQSVIPALRRAFHPKANQYWVAAGIEVTSYEMVKAQAVLSVAFGVELQVGVVGSCSMTLPTGTGTSEPLAYVEIDFVASFTPSTGLLAVDGKLSPASNLFGGFVKLTGGFAFYVWFGGDHKGDFVVTLGGYHPAFERPSHYPIVPRLGLSFALGPLKVAGQAYFALTSSSFMAGLRISATFAAGPVSAWFDAGVDFLVRWAPFHYEAGAWVTIGCSVDLGLFTINVQVGAALQIWGPDFGGRAVVDLDVVSFAIEFGARNTQPLPVGWNTFATNFLPPPQKPADPLRALAAPALDGARAEPTTNVIQASVEVGLLGNGPPGVDWIVDPDHFRVRTDSTLPANRADWRKAEKEIAELPNVVGDYRRMAPAPPPPPSSEAARAAAAPPDMQLVLDAETKTFSKTEVWAPTLNVAPMNAKDVVSHHVVALRRYDTGSGGYTEYVTGVAVAPQLRPSNTALWGTPEEKPDPNGPRLIDATLTGFAIMPVERKPAQVSNVALLALIFGEGHTTGFAYQRPAVDTRYQVRSSLSRDGRKLTIDVTGEHSATLPNEAYVLSSIDERWVADQRAATLEELRRLGFATYGKDEVDLRELAKVALTDWPSVGRIGALR